MEMHGVSPISVLRSSRIKWRIGRITFWMNRFRSLPRANSLFQDVEPGTVLSRPLFGHKLFCDVSREGPQRLLFLEGERHVPEARLLLGLLKRGFRVVDVGANIGYYVLLFSKGIGTEGNVIAIEPSPENLPELLLNVERNSLGNNVSIIARAVGSTTDVVGLKKGINSGVTSGGNAAYSVQIDKLDNLINDRVDFIKIDVEGFESFVLKGAADIILKWRPFLFVELHPVEVRQHGISIIDVVQQLQRLYSKIELYEIPKQNGLLESVFRRYFGIGPMREVNDVHEYVSQVAFQDSARPFWAVCRPEFCVGMNQI
jgi:FkbM family methyltransferase